VLDFVAIVLYLVGSYLNTGSELMRSIWKKDPSHKGKLYIEGLFKFSMHINYFGDSLLFSSFAFLTRSVWAFVIPVLMIVLFVFMHIPTLDKYLEQKYGDEFRRYASRTKKLVPFIY
jgi:steroid 5-alpha reductase family enzyme